MSAWAALRPRTIGTYRITLRRQLRGFIRDARHGRPCICHTCGEELYDGQWIQRVRVPALPWTMWRHRSLPCGPGPYSDHYGPGR